MEEDVVNQAQIVLEGIADVASDLFWMANSQAHHNAAKILQKIARGRAERTSVVGKDPRMSVVIQKAVANQKRRSQLRRSLCNPNRRSR